MRQRKWISALHIERWAETEDAKTRLPELVRRLIHGTVRPPEDIEHIDFPGGEQTQRPRYDGETKLKIDRGNAKVPDLVTYWEMGKDVAVKRKLDEDYNKRIDKRGGGDFSQTSYIAITPRHYQNKTAWAAEREKLSEWRQVRVYDSSDLEQWLELAPGVALWALPAMTGAPAAGVRDLSTHWENLQASLKMALPPAVVLVSRMAAVTATTDWLKSQPSILPIAGQSLLESVDFFAAYVAQLEDRQQAEVASRAIIVDQSDAWEVLVDSEQPLVLICSARLNIDEQLLSEAKRKGHHVLLPVSPLQALRDDVVRLERMNRSELEKALAAAGLSEKDAYVLAQQSGGSFSILKRRFSNVPVISTPQWANAPDTDDLASLLLLGGWEDENQHDQEIVAKLVGRGYAEARKVVVRWAEEEDAPVRLNSGLWEFLSPVDAWTFLHRRLSPATLSAFEDIARDVLGRDDPRLELPPEERWRAAVTGKEFPHSDELRKGISRTLAIIATQDG